MGGGLYLAGGTVTLNKVEIDGNTACGGAGGRGGPGSWEAFDPSQPTASDGGNGGDGGKSQGGGVFLAAGSLDVVASTIARNEIGHITEWDSSGMPTYYSADGGAGGTGGRSGAPGATGFGGYGGEGGAGGIAEGAGLYLAGGPVRIDRTYIVNNTAGIGVNRLVGPDGEPGGAQGSGLRTGGAGGGPSVPNSATAGIGTAARGGGIYFAGATTLTVTAPLINADVAGGDGGTGASGGVHPTTNNPLSGTAGEQGGAGQGGGLYVAGGSVSLTDTQVLGTASGGGGGYGGAGTWAVPDGTNHTVTLPGGTGGTGGRGGDAQGGAVFLAGGQLQLNGATVGGEAFGGPGGGGGLAGNGNGGNGGRGGDAQGGGLYLAGGTLVAGLDGPGLVGPQVSHSLAYGGTGGDGAEYWDAPPESIFLGRGGSGGDGGTAKGGGLFAATGAALSGVPLSVFKNQVTGGVGGAGAAGPNANGAAGETGVGDFPEAFPAVGPPPTFTRVASNPAVSTLTNTTLFAPFQVYARNLSWETPPRLNVTFTAPDSGPGGTFVGGATSATVVMDASSFFLATATPFTTNLQAGSYEVVARIEGVAEPLVFRVVNAPAPAPSTFQVANRNDTGDGSLRQAILAANAAPGSTIAFDASVTGTIALQSALPDITADMTIVGPGAGVLSIERGATAADSFGIFTIRDGAVTISDLTVARGTSTGISNSGILTLKRVVVRDNNAFFAAGGLFNQGFLTVLQSTIANNTTREFFFAGGVNSEAGSVTIVGSTISGNVSHQSNSTGGIGIYGGHLVIIGSTVTGNVTDETRVTNISGGGIDAGGDGVTIYNTIVAGNTGSATNPSDVAGHFTSMGHNLIGSAEGHSTGFAASDRVGTVASPIDARLDPVLRDNGGPTPTHALQSGSPALDAGDNNNEPATDQRDFSRVVNGTIDIGAFEFGAASTTPSNPPTDLALSSASVAENRPAGTVVGDFSSTDPNTGDTFTYSLVTGAGSDDNASFTLDSSGRLLTAAPFDFETRSSYSVRVRTTDQEGLSFENSFIVTVTDVNDNPTISDVPIPASIVELQLYSFDASAADPDLPAQTLTFSLVGAPSGASIDSSSGVFTWTPTEAQGPATYQFFVRVSDGSAYADAPIEVSVLAAGLMSGDLVVSGTSAADIIAVNLVNGDSAKVDVVINGQSQGRFALSAITGQIIVRGFSGSDKITIASGIKKNAHLDGGTGNDTLTGGGGNDSLHGGPDNDSLTGRKGNDTYFFGDSWGADKAVEAANSGTDRLDFSAATLGVTFTKGSTVSAKNGANSATGSVESIVGGSGIDTLVSTITATLNTWNVTGMNAGTLNTTLGFSGIENLTGSAGTDTFILSSGAGVTGTINGGLGANTISYAAYTTAVAVNLQTKTGSNVGAFNNVGSIKGGSGADTLTGADAVNTWNITANNGGTVGSTSFGSFESLAGGTLKDTFKFTNGKGVAGAIDGGAGSNTLNYAAYTTAVKVNLSLGTASRVTGGFTNLANATGGAGNDILVGDNAVNVLLGNAGRDILIGGLGADTVNGGSGDDLLIGGNTDFPSPTPASLDAVMAEWARTTVPFRTRIGHLTGASSGGLNGSIFLDATTVQNDSANDSLIGGSELDWFFTSTGDLVTDKTAAERQTIV